MIGNAALLAQQAVPGEQLWWFVARAGGIVSLVLAAASVIWGLLLASGLLERGISKRWLLDLHRWLGALTVIFTAVHVAALWMDSYIEYSLVDLAVPFATGKAPGRWPVAWGIIATYMLIAVQASSMVMKRLPRTWWRAIHMLSFGVLVTGIVHGATAGTDASSLPYLLGVIGLGLSTVFLTTYRVMTRRPKRKAVPA